MLLTSVLHDVVPFVLLYLSDVWSRISAMLWNRASYEQKKWTLPPPASVEDVQWAERRLAELTEGSSHMQAGDTGISARPTWLDSTRIARARQLHLQFWPSFNNAQVMSLFLSFTFGDSVQPLLWTGRSHTVRLARRRYVETALHTHSWSLGDIWDPDDEAYRNVERVRGMHLSVARRLEGKNISDVAVPASAAPPARQSRLPALQADLRPLPSATRCHTADAASAGCPMAPGYEPESQPLSQRSMVYTQWYFVGLLLLHPDKYGLSGLTDADWDSYLHLWRSIGRRLGIDDRYNLCAGSLSQVRHLCRLLEQRVMIPQLQRADPLWHVMTSALYDGLATVFQQCQYEAWLYYLVRDVLRLPSARLRASLSWTGLWKYHLMRLTFAAANNSPLMHGSIRARVKPEFQTAATEEQLPSHLTYVFNHI